MVPWSSVTSVKVVPILVGGDTPDQRRLRRVESGAEAVPVKQAIEVVDAPERAGMERPPEEDLVRSASAVRGVRTVAVVEDEEVGAEALHLGAAVEEPDEGRDRGLEGPKQAFDAAIRPGMGGADERLLHAVGIKEEPESVAAKLRSVVGDDSGCYAGVFFASCLENDFNIDLLHFFTDVLMDDTAAESIQDRGHEVERPGDIDVRNVDMPVFMSHERLLKSGTFFER